VSDGAIILPTADEWAAQAINAEWWHTAIGRVVTAAAGLEAAVGTLLHAMEVGDTDHLYALMVGRLVKRSRDQLPGLEMRDAQLAEQIGVLLDKIDLLLDRRNDVVHGWWRFGIDGVSAIRGRARRGAPDLVVHQVKREDIVLLAGELESARHAALRYAASVAVTPTGPGCR
jgi:hypothetical protein